MNVASVSMLPATFSHQGDWVEAVLASSFWTLANSTSRAVTRCSRESLLSVSGLLIRIVIDV